MVQSASAGKKLTKALLDEGREYAKTIVEGLNASPSHFHAVNFCKQRLRDEGFIELKEIDKWPQIEVGKGYYFTRNGSTICAFLAGAKVGKSPVSSFKIIGCHTDSPCLKLAPISKVDKFGYRQLNVMTYGGGLWRTWFDRDLILAVKIIVKEN